MAIYTITSITVPLPLNDEVLIAGEAIDAGEVVYQLASDEKAYLAFSGGTEAQAQAIGWATCSAAAGQPVSINRTQVMTINTGLSVTRLYFLSSTPGAMEEESDIATGDTEYKTLLATGLTATTLWPNVWPLMLTVP